MEIRVLSAEDIARSLSMREAIVLMRTTFAQLSAGQVTMPQRLRLDTRDGCTLLMPAYLRQTGDCCVKVVSVYGSNPAQGLPSVTGVVVVLDSKTGLPMGTLDSLFRDRSVRHPLLVKLDVQGFELEVLRGGAQILDRAEVVILEAALLPYNKGAPLLSEVILFMEHAGFVVYDFCGQFRRQTDHALFQTDVAFVKEGSDLRAPRKFYLHEP